MQLGDLSKVIAVVFFYGDFQTSDATDNYRLHNWRSRRWYDDGGVEGEDSFVVWNKRTNLERLILDHAQRSISTVEDTMPRYRRNSFMQDVAVSTCPSHTEWRVMHTARDINNTEVQVFQPEDGSGQGSQWFYTVTCKNSHGLANGRRECPGCCVGIDHNRFWSSCRQRKSYVMALVRHQHQHHFEWNWIQVDSSCNCAITPKINEML